ncbi:hypothetical protein ACMYSO_23785 [Klebsiella sp. B345]
MLVKQFWALTVYNCKTLYVSPVAPTGLQNNWIPISGKRPLLAIRF